MDFKTLEDGRIVISTPTLSSTPQKLSAGRLQDKTYCCCILRLNSWLRLTPLYKYLLPFSGESWSLIRPPLGQGLTNSNHLFSTFLVIFCCAIVVVTFKDYARAVLFWIEKQNSWLVFIVLLVLFTIVSFPIVVGYLLLIITSGYLLGCFHGLLTVILGVNLGIFIAHNTIKSINRRCSISRYKVKAYEHQQQQQQRARRANVAPVFTASAGANQISTAR